MPWAESELGSFDARYRQRAAMVRLDQQYAGKFPMCAGGGLKRHTVHAGDFLSDNVPRGKHL